MRIRSNGMLPAMGLISSLFLSAGCAMPQRRVNSKAQKDSAQIERSVADIKYNTSMPAVDQIAKYPSPSTDVYRSPVTASTSQATESKSGGSCCH